MFKFSNSEQLLKNVKEYKKIIHEDNINKNKMENEQKTPVVKQEKIKINTDSLRMIAIYLSGLKDGKGNLLPLGTIVLEDLWDAVSYLQGDARFISERDTKLPYLD